jgi:hypothetical protein
MGLLRKSECPRCMRYTDACICSRSVKVTTKGLKPAKPRAAATAQKANPDSGQRMCVELCGPRGQACGSTIRGSHPCPCPRCP